MAENQDDITNLNKLIDEIMRENVEAVEEVQLEPQPGEEINVEQGTQPKEDKKPEKEATEDYKEFISKEAQELWNKILFDKEFVCERGFGKLISPFSEVTEKKGWGFFCEHKAPGFSALSREFYANMVGMKEDSVYVRGVWVPFGDRKINEMFKLRDLKKKMLGKMNAKMESFYNNQFRRDADLLNILKKKEAENEAKMLKKIEGFKYLYRE